MDNEISSIVATIISRSETVFIQPDGTVVVGSHSATQGAPNTFVPLDRIIKYVKHALVE